MSQVIRFRRILIRGKCNFSKYGRIAISVRQKEKYTAKKKLLREPNNNLLLSFFLN